MALLEILKYPDPRLRTVAAQVTEITPELRRMVADMFETMYAVQGVGLAATQVNIHQRFFVMDISDSRDQPRVVINPEILSKSGISYEAEGCLSVGGAAFDKVERAAVVTLRGMDLEGKTFEIVGEHLMANCFQHEIDHLNGVLFIDHLSRLKQDRIRKKIEKEQRR